MQRTSQPLRVYPKLYRPCRARSCDCSRCQGPTSNETGRGPSPGGSHEDDSIRRGCGAAPSVAGHRIEQMGGPAPKAEALQLKLQLDDAIARLRLCERYQIGPDATVVRLPSPPPRAAGPDAPIDHAAPRPSHGGQRVMLRNANRDVRKVGRHWRRVAGSWTGELASSGPIQGIHVYFQIFKYKLSTVYLRQGRLRKCRKLHQDGDRTAERGPAPGSLLTACLETTQSRLKMHSLYRVIRWN